MQTSNNGTIFHYRSFLTYHIDRVFKDHSLIFEKKSKMIAVLSAAEVMDGSKKVLCSHPGASFGGLILNIKSSLSDIIEIIHCIESYAVKNDFQELTIIPTPLIYTKNNDESFLYALKWENYNEIEQYYSSIIPIYNNTKEQCQSICKNNGRSYDFYDKIIQSNDLKINWSDHFEDFYSILLKDKEKYKSNPTHSVDEIKKLCNTLPDKIKLLTVEKDNQVIGGSLIFIANNSIGIIFYNTINYDFSDMQISTIQIIELIKWARTNNIDYLDFGVSHKAETNTPLAPKMSLIKFKEKFDSFGIMRFVYNKRLNDQ